MPKVDSGAKKTHKVMPSDKKKDVSSMAKSMLQNHPEVLYGAKPYFRNENGQQVVQDIVPRGDLKTEDVIMPRKRGDLTEEDLKGLAVYATMIINEILSKYDPNVANEDALTMAIQYKDSGKYANKVDAPTYALILGNMKKIKNASDNNNVKKVSLEEEKMDKEALQKELANLEIKKAAIEVLLNDGDTSKEAAGNKETVKCPYGCGSKVLKQTGYCPTCKKKIKMASEEVKEEAKVEVPEEEVKKEAVTAESVLESLDKLAGDLEAQDDIELKKIAYQLDLVADVIEGRKEAKVLESDPDESYMKEYFKAGVREKDSDEPYMNEFNNDNTTEVGRVVGKVSVGEKKASEKLPYEKK